MSCIELHGIAPKYLLGVIRDFGMNIEKVCLFSTFFQGRIAFLQGERRAQENLKNDLVRRIKMLEFALKQERLVPA